MTRKKVQQNISQMQIIYNWVSGINNLDNFSQKKVAKLEEVQDLTHFSPYVFSTQSNINNKKVALFSAGKSRQKAKKTINENKDINFSLTSENEGNVMSIRSLSPNSGYVKRMKNKMEHVTRPKTRPATLEYPKRNEMRHVKSVSPHKKVAKIDSKRKAKKSNNELNNKFWEATDTEYVNPQLLLKQFRQKDIGRCCN